MLSCQDCKKWVYDLKTGKLQLYGGKPVRQHPKGPPCMQEPGICPKGAPGRSDLTEQNRRVVEHFEQCRATGQFPDDGIVHQHAALLERIVRGYEQSKETDHLVLGLAKVFTKLKR
jgi:hypothetical protein